MAFTAIRTATADGVATITLARLDRLNAFTGVMHAELRAALDAAESDAAMGCVVLTGDILLAARSAYLQQAFAKIALVARVAVQKSASFLAREFVMRSSEPKPHEINKLLVSFDSEVRK